MKIEFIILALVIIFIAYIQVKINDYKRGERDSFVGYFMPQFDFAYGYVTYRTTSGTSIEKTYGDVRVEIHNWGTGDLGSDGHFGKGVYLGIYAFIRSPKKLDLPELKECFHEFESEPFKDGFLITGKREGNFQNQQELLNFVGVLDRILNRHIFQS